MSELLQQLRLASLPAEAEALRTEVRAFRSGEALWPGAGRPGGSRTGLLAVLSVALTL